MHIEPGIVDGSKLLLSYATASAAGGVALTSAFAAAKKTGVPSLLFRVATCTALVFCFFEVFPHARAGISEVHLILGSTLFLLFGLAPSALGLAFGLLLQGLFFEPVDLPQYGMNVTTLLVPIFAMAEVAKRTIAPATAYVDLSYRQSLALSTTYQAGVIAWVAFWVFYGSGFASETVASVVRFGGAYALVIVVEPLVDLAVLFAAKSLQRLTDSGMFTSRLHHAAEAA